MKYNFKMSTILGESIDEDMEDSEKCAKIGQGQGSPRVSGSGQVDTVDTGDHEVTSAIKTEADRKPLLRDTEANTVKSGNDQCYYYHT